MELMGALDNWHWLPRWFDLDKGAGAQMTNTILDRRDIAQAQSSREAAQSQIPTRGGIVDDFIRSLGETAGARLIAANRLIRRDRRVTELTAFCSVYLIILSLLPYLLALPPEVITHLDFFRILLSIVILIAAIFHYSSSNYVKSEQLNRSGLELNELKREIEMRKYDIDFDEVDILRIRYENILQKYVVNHDNFDRLQYKIENIEQYPSITSFSAFLMGTEISIRQSMPRVLLIIISLVVLFLTLSLFGSYPARLSG
jgi:SMODS and SLOG-associating 2TM effector domain family 5